MATMIYWTEADQARSQRFPDDSLVAALKFSEELRGRRRHGEPITFITSVTEHADSVGQLGVSDPPADYDWKKRRV